MGLRFAHNTYSMWNLGTFQSSVKCLSILKTSLVNNFRRLKAAGVSKKLPQKAAVLESRF